MNSKKMQEPIGESTYNLSQLFDITVALFRDEERITRSLDWVDQVLPVFTNACRCEVHSSNTDAIARWLTWLDTVDAHVIAEAGKGEVFNSALRKPL
jgi:hypothetical protein